MEAKEVEVMDWYPLAISYAKKYRHKSPMQDLIQQGMVGVILAAKTYDGTTTFQSWAGLHIRREIQRLVYTDLQRNQYRAKEVPIEPHMIEELMGTGDDGIFEQMYTNEFILSLPLAHREREFFMDMVEYGRLEGGKMYMDRTGMTRQGMGLQRAKILTIAEECYAV